MSDDINFLGSVPLGKIFTWRDSKTANLTPVTFPGKDSGFVEAIDTLGITVYFDITGRLTGSFRSIQGYVYDLKNIADGLQLSSRRLMSPFVNGNAVVSNVKIRRMGNIGYNTTATANKLIDTNASFQTWNITTLDKVKNLVTGEVTTIVSIDSEHQLTLAADKFPVANTPYAVTAYINVKIINADFRWELPGLSWCDYSMSFIQVK